MGLWLAEKEPSVRAPTLARYTEQCRAGIIPFFQTYEEITEATVASYTSLRLKKVRGQTVNRELTVLRQFLEWSRRQGLREHPLPIDSVPPRMKGTPHKNGSHKVVELSPEQVAALIAALPEVPPRGKAPARDFMPVVFETGLRYGTVAQLATPKHFTLGEASLTITKTIDKAGFARVLPITAKAQAALERHAQTRGLIFGRVDIRIALKRAAAAIGLPPEDARHVSHHDFRHARLTEMADSMELTTAAYLALHKNVTTTIRYVHPRERKAKAALDALSRRETDTRADTAQSAEGGE